MKRRPRRSKTCRGLGRAAQQISCQSCVVVLYLFSQRRPGGDRRADRRSLNRGVSVAGIAAREGLTAKRSRPEMAPQQVEKIESAPGNGMVPEAANPQDVVNGRAADRARLRWRAANDKVAKVAEKGAQGFEIARCKTEIGACRRRNAGRARWRGIVREAWSGRPPTSALSGARKKLIGRTKGGKFSWLQTIEKSRNAEAISAPLPPRRPKPRPQSVSASPIRAACFAACAIAASAACPPGWMRPADMISFAASSGDIGSSMMSLVGTKK